VSGLHSSASEQFLERPGTCYVLSADRP
jgi:hypothetical protein